MPHCVTRDVCPGNNDNNSPTGCNIVPRPCMTRPASLALRATSSDYHYFKSWRMFVAEFIRYLTCRLYLLRLMTFISFLIYIIRRMSSRFLTSAGRLLSLRLSVSRAYSTTTTMTSKRKRTGAHPPPPVPEMPDAPRRSSRRIKDAAERPKSDTDPMKAADPKKAKAVWDTGEGVEEAMRELSEMEQKLQTVVRTQRLAVESSDLQVKKEAANEPDIRPKMYSPNKDTVVPRGNLEGKSKVVNSVPLDEYDAELAAGDVADAKDEDDGMDRGANRPPPVNSETLPLPWKGRLGYVSLAL